MKSLTESIIGSNNASVFSETVFNKLVREKFEDAFKNLVNFKYRYKDPLEYDMVGYFVLGWAFAPKKSDDAKKEFSKSVEKFTKSIKQYKPRMYEDNIPFKEGVIKNFEIILQKHPNIWYDDPTFHIILAEDVEGLSHSRYYLLVGYDDTGIDDIFNPENT